MPVVEGGLCHRHLVLIVPTDHCPVGYSCNPIFFLVTRVGIASSGLSGQ